MAIAVLFLSIHFGFWSYNSNQALSITVLWLRDKVKICTRRPKLVYFIQKKIQTNLTVIGIWILYSENPSV